MVSSSETVRYEFEVITKGLEELTKLKNTLTEMKDGGGGSSSRISWVQKSLDKFKESISGLNTASKENVEVTKEQDLTGELLGNRMKKMAGPLRSIGEIFNKLNPTVLLASLGLGGVTAAVASLADGADKEMASLANIAALINQYSTESTTLFDTFKRIREEADALDLSLSDVQAAYLQLIPMTRDMSVAQGILSKANEIHKNTSIPLLDVVNQLATAYKDGAFIIDEYGGKIYLGIEAVEAMAKAMMVGNDVIEQSTEISDTFAANIESIALILKGSAKGIELSFKALINQAFDPNYLNDKLSEMFSVDFSSTINEFINAAIPGSIENWLNFLSRIFSGDSVGGAITEAFGDFGNLLWRHMAGPFEDLVGPVTGLIKDMFNADSVLDAVTGAFSKVGEWVWEPIEQAFLNIIMPGWAVKLYEWFAPQAVKDFVDDTFGKVVGWIWDKVEGGWNLIINGWNIKIIDWFKWETIGNAIQTTFVRVPSSMWESVVSSWAELLDLPFINKIKEFFSWERIFNIISTVFVKVPVTIWNWIVSEWNKELDLPFITKIAELLRWDRTLDLIRLIFVKVPGSIWEWISSRWEDALDTEFFTSIEKLLSWQRIRDTIKLIFITVPSEIWKWIRSRWDGYLESPFISKIRAIFDWNKVSSAVMSFVRAIQSKLSFTVKLPTVSTPLGDVGGQNINIGLPKPSDASPTGQPDTDIDTPGGFFPELSPYGVHPFAEGGIIRKPTIGLLGEERPERVTPLYGRNSANGGENQPINIYLDSKLIASKVLDKLDKDVRMRGGR